MCVCSPAARRTDLDRVRRSCPSISVAFTDRRPPGSPKHLDDAKPVTGEAVSVVCCRTKEGSRQSGVLISSSPSYANTQCTLRKRKKKRETLNQPPLVPFAKDLGNNYTLGGWPKEGTAREYLTPSGPTEFRTAACRQCTPIPPCV